jgi:DNA-binding SARP family transcriptional activator
MTETMKQTRTVALRQGVAALLKSGILTLGVPFAVLRLLQLTHARSYSSIMSLLIHLVLGAVAASWLIALYQLAREVVHALRTPDSNPRASWSSSWAAGIVGLLLLAGSFSTQGSAPKTPTPVTATMHRQPTSRSASLLNFAPTVVTEELLGGLGVLLASGLLRRLKLLGHLRIATREVSSTVRRPGGDLEMFERSLESTDSERLIDWIEATNRVLGAVVVDGHQHDYPEVVLLRAGSDGIELLLGKPLTSPPIPFRATEGGWWWTLDPSITLSELTRLGDGAPRLVPWLLPIGDDGSSELLVALPPKQILGIVGPEEEVDGAIRSLLMSMRILPWCDELSVELLGVDPPALNQRSVHLQRSSLQTIASLQDRPPLPRRLMHERWRREPLVVVHQHALSEQSKQEVLRTNGQAGAVVAGMKGTMTLVVDGLRGELQPFGIPMDLHLINEDDGRFLERLLAAYAQPLEVVRFERASHYLATERHDCVIKILGRSIEIVGAQRIPDVGDLDRVHELVVFLALHEYLVTKTQLIDALYRDTQTEVATRRLENLIATARAMLGRDQNGIDRVQLSPDGYVVLDKRVGLDWYELEGLFTQAKQIDGARALDLLAGAIDQLDAHCVLGEPMHFPWFRAMRYDEYIKTCLIDACHHLATLAFACDDHTTAKRALTFGRAVEPSSEILARDQMVLASMQGAPAEIEQIYHELTMTLNDLAGAEPSVVTSRLYMSLRTM